MGMHMIAPGAGANGVLASECDGDRRRDGGWEWLNLANQMAQGHIQNQIDRLAGQVGDTAASTQRHLGDIGHRNSIAVLESASATQREIATSSGAIRDRLCAVETGLGREIAATQRQAADLARELAMQTERNDARLTLELEKRTNDIEVQAERNAAAAALAAATNTAALQAAIAACCCETRELIRAESNTLQRQADDIARRRLETELADAKAQLLACRLGGVAGAR